MPNALLDLDTGLPVFNGQEGTEEKVTRIQNYLYMLLEQLRYTLRNLDASNCNGAALAGFSSELTAPLYARVKDTDGNVAALELTATGLQSQVTAEVTRATGAEGTLSSRITQTAEAISLTAAYGSGSIGSNVRALLTLTANPDSANIQIQADKIDFTGFTTFLRPVDLGADGTTTIDGGRIVTGTISADRIDAQNLKLCELHAMTQLTTKRVLYAEWFQEGASNFMTRVNLVSDEVRIGNDFFSGRVYVRGGSVVLGSTWSTLGFFDTTPVTRRTVASNATVAEVITALKAYGLFG